MTPLTRRSFLGGLAGLTVTQARSAGAARRGRRPPNVVVVMSDDQTVESLRVMPRTTALLGGGGTTFTTAFATTPLCSPSRATLLSGQHAHNHGVAGNAFAFQAFDHANALPVWLRAAGYRTAFVGKHLNAYNDATLVPPGWDHWFALVAPSSLRYYDYVLSDDGRRVVRGSDPSDYQTDVLAARAVELTAQLAAGPDPFFLWFAPIAPHGVGGDLEPPVPAPRHAGRFADEPLPRPPSFDEADVADKPAAVRNLAPIGPNALRDITVRYRARLESLLAEDEAVDAILGALRDAGALDDTLVVFTSDNGFFHGEHRIRTGKVELYEPSVRVPLLVRGRGFARGATVAQPVANVDVATTIVAAAGATPGRTLDGVDLRATAAGAVPAGRPILLQSGRPDDERLHVGIRTTRWLYVEHGTGERELYDLVADADQLVSRHDDPAYDATRLRLARALRRLRSCSGAACA